MRIALSADHRGIELVRRLAEVLAADGHDAEILGTCDGTSCDYPDQAWVAGGAVADGAFERGVFACGSGIGISMAANKIPGVRAALVHDADGAEASRRHNDANVLCLPADTMPTPTAESIVRLWLETPFEGGRHARRVAKMESIERGVDPRETQVRAESG